jgi:hypothetical protein
MLRRTLGLLRTILGSTPPTPTPSGPTTPGGTKPISGSAQPVSSTPPAGQVPPTVASTSVLTLAAIAAYRLMTSPRATIFPYATPAIKASPAINIASPLAQKIKKHMCKTYELLNTEKNLDVVEDYVKNNVLNLADAQTVIETCNELLRHDKEFREFISKCIEESMHKTSPLLKYDYISSDHKPVPVFRSLVIKGSYGDPKFVEEQGLTASLLNLRSRRIVVPASVNTFIPGKDQAGEYQAPLKIPGRYDMQGYTLGAHISTTLNVCHAFDQRFMRKEDRKKCRRFVYLFDIEKGYNLGPITHSKAGYIGDTQKGLKGVKGTSNVEDAAEIAVGPVITPREALGYREVNDDDTIEPFVKFPHASDERLKELMNYADVKFFMEVETVEEAQELEVLLVGDRSKVEGHDEKLIRHTKKNKELKKDIESEAKGFGKDALLSLKVHGPAGIDIAAAKECKSTREHLERVSKAHNHSEQIRQGKLMSGPQRLFHSLKAQSEEELKERAIRAKKQLAGETGDVHKTPRMGGKKKK